MNIIETEHFKASEIIGSNKAKENNIDNTPKNDEIIGNINYTLQRLEKIRIQYNKPIVITSGYRCEELNRLVGGVKDSYHLSGLAVDLKYDSELFGFIKKNCKYDKLILERGNKHTWIHLQFRKGNERNCSLTLYPNEKFDSSK